MKKIVGRNKILKEAAVLSIAVLLVLSTGAVLANTQYEKDDLEISVSVSEGVIGNLRDEGEIRFDNGVPTNMIGISSGGILWEGAIRATPDELAQYDGWELTKVTFYHGAGTGEPLETHEGAIKIYDQGTSSTPGSLLNNPAANSFIVDVEDWFEVVLDTPIIVDGSRDMWISVETTTIGTEHYMGMDGGPYVEGKGQWVWLNNQWQEAIDWGINGNWNFIGTVVGIEPLNADAGGPYEAYIDEDIQFAGTATGGTEPYTYYWDFGDDTNSTEEDPVKSYDTEGVYDVNFTVTDSGRTIAWDETTANITEEPLEAEFNITEIAGGMGVTATIKNVGETAATNLEWNIQVTGGFLGLVDADVDGNKSSLAIDATEDAASGSLGFLHLGGLDITVTADADNADKISKDYTAFIIGPFVISIKEA